MSGPFGDMLAQRLRRLSDTDRENMRRLLTGEAEKDLVRRGVVIAVIRQLRTSPASLASPEYQAALRDVQKLVGLIPNTQEGRG